MLAAPPDRAREIARLAEDVAREVLSDDYAALARRAADEVARRIPDRLASGQPKSWACAVVYALGRINFLSDPAQPVHMPLAELCAAFGVSPATGSAKAHEVLAALDMFPLDPRWTLPGLAASNPLAWMLLIDDIPTDARTLPPEAQDALARAGMIPFGPTVQASGPAPEGPVVLEQSDGPFAFHVLAGDAPAAPTRRAFGRRHRGRGAEIATLHVELAETEPPVWRRLALPLGTPLDDVHLTLQRAVGWQNCHLHAFEAESGRYVAFEPDADERPTAGRTLADLVSGPGGTFGYTYDFGDDWEHVVAVEAVGPPEPGLAYPVCLGGERAGPPEDCGGPYGYADLCAALADPKHPEHDELLGWLGYPFDPAAFDTNAVNRLLRAPAR